MQTHLYAYLDTSDYIDWQHPLVKATAAKLATGCHTDTEVAKQCFEFVRDSIKHSWDYRINPLTCKASEVLSHGTGYCYAKSHLLAALLRANGIPAGLCYQRLSVGNGGAPYCLHGLNALYLQQYGWYRVDARGNKTGVNAIFAPPEEHLAFPIMDDLEQDFLEIWPEPLPLIIKALTCHKTVEQLAENLPDIEIAQTKHRHQQSWREQNQAGIIGYNQQVDEQGVFSDGLRSF
ncbi:MAG: transglutaminase domain-containing protein [Methylovulum sp.]|nr:transglutaminase domain-containing protein [Methylovulum sp.]